MNKLGTYLLRALIIGLLALCACSTVSHNDSSPSTAATPSRVSTPSATPQPKASASRASTVPHISYGTFAPASLACQALASFAPTYVSGRVVYLGQSESPECDAFDVSSASNNLHLELVGGSAVADNAQKIRQFKDPAYELCNTPITTTTVNHVQFTYCARPTLFVNHFGQEISFAYHGYHGYLTTEITPDHKDPKLNGAILKFGLLVVKYIASHS